MIECSDPATCQQIAEQMKIFVTNAVVGGVAIIVFGQIAWNVLRQKYQTEALE